MGSDRGLEGGDLIILSGRFFSICEIISKIHICNALKVSSFQCETG